jgi:hypothetical protein
MHRVERLENVSIQVTMPPQRPSRKPRRAGRLRGPLCWLSLLGLVSILTPAASPAATTTFGSPLAVAATQDTANDLDYTGTDIALPLSVFHIPHDGADTALWNTKLASGTPTAPEGGQITSVRLEGCAKRPEGAPRPLTEIHFQDLAPLSGGAVKVNVTTQAFDIPVCGENGASGSTVTSYDPTNFCVSQGDYVDFADEGGFVGANGGPPPYPSGVPYIVIGSVPGSSMDSFVRNGGVNNGSTYSPADRTSHDGFASNPGEELMLQATLATGPDATPLCPGGTRGVTSGYGRRPPPPPRPQIHIGAQTIGVNHSRVASVAIYCRPLGGCTGVATLTPLRRHAKKGSWGRTRFTLRGGKTAHVPIRVAPAVIRLLRRHRAAGVRMTLSALVNGQTFSQTITLKIF